MREESDDQQISDQSKLDPVSNYDNCNDSSIFSPLIPMTILLISYSYWEIIEKGVGIENRSGSFFFSNFIFIFTVIISSLLFKLGPKLITINDPALLEKWEENNSEYQRIFWMNPLDLHRQLSLAGKLLNIFLNSIAIGLFTVFTSTSIVLTFIFLFFEANFELIIILVIPVVFTILIFEIYVPYDAVYSATGLYLHGGFLVTRTALIFRSLPGHTYKPEKLIDIFIKETHSFRYDIPLYYLKSSKSRWTGNVLAYSDDYEKMRELKLVIENYIKTAPQAES